MAITRIKNSSIASNGPKYDNALAGLPYRPTIGTATDGGTGTTVSVAFTENNSAGAGITYTALSTPGSLTGTGSSSPVTVSGLTTGTAYTFQVKAGNSLGDSAYSSASNSVTPISPSSYESIATAVGTGGNFDIDFTSIPSTFKHLQIRGIVKDTFTTSASVSNLTVRFNNDSGNNYAWHNLIGNGSAASATGAASTNIIDIKSAIIASHSTQANTVGTFIIDILDYASTSKNKTVRIFHGIDANISSTNYTVGITSGLWQSTSAINRITIGNPNLNFYTTTTSIALYGIKEF